MESKIIFTSSNNENLTKLKKSFGNEHSYYILDLSDSERIINNIGKSKMY